MKFRRKPTVIEAEQFFHDKPLPLRDRGAYVMFEARNERFYVVTAHHQRVYLDDGDWVTPEPSGGQFAYPIKPDIMAATYEAVNLEGQEK